MYQDHQMTTPPANVSAVILCGGQSRRMGSDKGLLAPEGFAWVATLRQELASLSLPVYVSLREDQREAYQPIVSPEQLIFDKVWENVAGPLVGILSAALHLPNQHLLVVPCDMPRLRQEVFAQWISAFHRHTTAYQAFISQTVHRWQPLCGIYHRSGLEVLTQHAQQGSLQGKSVHAVLEDVLTTFAVEIPTALTPQFANYNTPEDLS